MPYIGKIPAIGNYQVLDALTATTTDTYALTKNSVAVFPQTPANCIVSLNGVIQAPFDSYTISGSNIVFASALTGSDSIDFITVLGDVLNVGTVSDGTIGLAKLSATGTKDATTFLRGDNTFATPAGGTNTPAFEASLSSTQAINTASYTKVQFATEIFDTNSAYDNVTNYRFTPAVTGKYYLFSELCLDDLNDGSFFDILLYKNGSSIKQSRLFSGVTEKQSSWFSYIDVSTSASDYYEIFVYQNTGVTRNLRSDISGYFGGYKIIE